MGGDLGGRGLDEHFDVVAAARGTACDVAADEGGDVVERWGAQCKRRTGARGVADAVDPERAPVAAIEVIGNEVPAAAEWDQLERLDHAGGLGAVGRAIGERGPLGVAAAKRQRR